MNADAYRCTAWYNYAITSNHAQSQLNRYRNAERARLTLILYEYVKRKRFKWLSMWGQCLDSFLCVLWISETFCSNEVKRRIVLCELGVSCLCVCLSVFVSDLLIHRRCWNFRFNSYFAIRWKIQGTASACQRAWVWKQCVGGGVFDSRGVPPAIYLLSNLYHSAGV